MYLAENSVTFSGILIAINVSHGLNLNYSYATFEKKLKSIENALYSLAVLLLCTCLALFLLHFQCYLKINIDFCTYGCIKCVSIK